jgi:DNA-binding NarL/FixJ family response regulator
VADTPIRTAAVFNASADTVETLKMLLSLKGFRAISGEADQVKSGELDFIDFLKTHNPDALIWDISPPYDRNWRFFQMVRALRPLEHCVIVLTTTHKKHLDDLAGQQTGAIEIVGKPYDLETIVGAVEQGLAGRSSTGARILKHGIDGS